MYIEAVMKTNPLAALLGFIFLVGCNNNTTKQPKQEPAQQAGQSTLPDLSETDSIELIYYPNPADQRNYERLVLTDTALVRNLTGMMMEDTARLSECPHPVKLYLFRKGDVYKTVYANTSDSCRYFAYAIGAKPVYVPMQVPAAMLLDSLVAKTK